MVLLLLFCYSPSSSCMVNFPNHHSQCLHRKSKYFGPRILHPEPFLTSSHSCPPACALLWLLSSLSVPRQAFAVPKVPFLHPTSSWRPAISKARSWALRGIDVHSTWRSYGRGDVIDQPQVQKSSPHCFLVMWSYANYLISWFLNFLMCNWT